MSVNITLGLPGVRQCSLVYGY